MPTLAEWSSEPREVTVKGSSALGCETKQVREYLRVICRGRNDTRGTPTAIEVRRGGRDAVAFVVDGVTSLVLPVVEGTDFAAGFSWSDKSHELVVRWPRGAPKPEVVGVFEGAKSPLDGRGFDAARYCTCWKEKTGRPTCDEMIVTPECTHHEKCRDVLACSDGEPGFPPKCDEGFIAGPGNGCYKACKNDGECPSPDERCNLYLDPRPGGPYGAMCF
jgi:hypothetical protein